jgi:hypothetical protein
MRLLRTVLCILTSTLFLSGRNGEHGPRPTPVPAGLGSRVGEPRIRYTCRNRLPTVACRYAVALQCICAMDDDPVARSPSRGSRTE